MGRLFGTDGARGVANSELTCELAMQIGRAAAMGAGAVPVGVVGEGTDKLYLWNHEPEDRSAAVQ